MGPAVLDRSCRSGCLPYDDEYHSTDPTTAGRCSNFAKVCNFVCRLPPKIAENPWKTIEFVNKKHPIFAQGLTFLSFSGEHRGKNEEFRRETKEETWAIKGKI